MTDKKPERPPPGFSAFKDLLRRIVRVSKSEIDEKEAEYRREREILKKSKRA